LTSYAQSIEAQDTKDNRTATTSHILNDLISIVPPPDISLFYQRSAAEVTGGLSGQAVTGRQGRVQGEEWFQVSGFGFQEFKKGNPIHR
jgi:hypothetical protein